MNVLAAVHHVVIVSSYVMSCQLSIPCGENVFSDEIPTALFSVAQKKVRAATRVHVAIFAQWRNWNLKSHGPAMIPLLFRRGGP